MITKVITTAKQLIIFALLLLTFSNLAAQSFTASQNQSDLFIDVNWTLDVDPCLLSPTNSEYDRVRLRLKSNGVQVLEEIYEAEDLEAFYGPTQPSFSYVSSETSSLALYSTPGHPTLTNFTFETWCRRNQASAGFKILRDANTAEIFFGNSNIVRFRKNNNTTNIVIDTMPAGFESTDWFHIAIVNNASLNKIIVYINGQPIGEVNNQNLNGLSTLTFLQRESQATSPSIEFAEMRLWNDVRTAAEINSFYLFPSSFPQANLLARWNVTQSGISNDLSSLEGAQVLTKTGTFSNNAYTPTPDYAPLTGTFRDNIGPGLSRNYQLLLNYGLFGQTEADCSGITAMGSTLPIQAPGISASDDFFDRIKINFTNQSDLPSRLDLVRDDTLILASYFSPIAKGQMFTYLDSFDMDNANSVVSDYPHKYHIRMTSNQNNSITNFPFDYGITRQTLFNVYNNNNNLQLSWEYTLPNGYNYEIWRNGRRLAVVSGNDYNFTDTRPILGDTIEYQLRAVKNGRIYLLVKSNAFLPPNGKIAGQVITQSGNYPVQNVTVKAMRTSTGQIFSDNTDDLGFFEIPSLPYGLKDSFLLTAVLSNHTFNYPTPYVTLDQNNPEKTEVVILDNFEYNLGNENIDIDNLVALPFNNLDKVQIAWNASASSAQPIVEVSRNGSLIFREKGSQYLNQSITDFGGIPNKLTDYKLRVYSFDINNKVSLATLSHVIAYPNVSSILPQDFNVTMEEYLNNPTGNINLTWTDNSTNIDGYKIYRNDQLIATIASGVTSFVDETAFYNTDYIYKISKIRIVDNATFEGEAVEAPSINMGAMPAPVDILVVPDAAKGYMQISWFANPAIINEETNYTGFYIYRNNKKIGFSIKGQPKTFRDMTGLDSMYLYGVSLYRQYPDGSIVESNIALDGSLKQYPTVPSIVANSFTLTQNKTANQNEVFLNWTASPNAINYDGYRILKNGNIIALLPPEVTSFYDNAPLTGLSQYLLDAYKLTDGTYRLSPFFIKNTSSTPFSSPLPNPTNVTVTSSYPNGAKICWDYDPFVPAEFIIYKNNTVLDTVSTESRSYFDFVTTYDTLPRYKVSAYYSGPLSPNVEKSLVLGTTAKYNQRVFIYGRIVDTNTKLGIPYSQIKISVDGEPFRLAVIADSLGFYKLDLDRHKASNYYINFQISAGTCYDCITQSLLIQPNKETYSLNVEYAINIPVNNDKIAKVVGINGISNYYDIHNILYWNMSNNNYDGIEVIKGLEKLSTVMLGGQLTIVDSLPVPGITYKYALRPYKMDGNKKVVTDYYDFDFTTPEFLPVDNLTATPRSDENIIQIEWGHIINNADYYVVLRNGSLYTQVNSDQAFRVIDSTGIPGEMYEYEVLGIKTRGQNTFVSKGVKVNALYPRIGKPIGLTAEVPFLTNVPGGLINPYPTYYLNHVLLKWKYNDEQNIGFNVYRNGEFIASVDKNSREYRDYNGIPGLIFEYSVAPKILRNGIIYEGSASEASILFPDLSMVSHISVTPRLNLGDVKLTFQYNMQGADGFKIQKLVNSVFTTIKIMDYDSTKNTFEFIDRTNPNTDAAIYLIYTFKNVEGIEYSSVGTYSNAFNYPPPPPVLTYDVTNTYTRSVDIHTWNALDSAYFDGYQIHDNLGNPMFTFDKFTKRELIKFPFANLFDIYQFKISTYRNLSGTSKKNSTLVTGERYKIGTVYTPGYMATNVEATDGTLNNTSISWDGVVNCVNCNPPVPINWYIYRDKIKIGIVPFANTEFIDALANLLPGVSEAVKGRKYVYEVCTCETYDISNVDLNEAGDVGFSKREGKITGHVYARESTKGVPNVKVTALGIDPEFNSIMGLSTTTQADGSFVIENIYVGEAGIKYKLIAEYADHEFQLPDSIPITPNNPSYFGAVIYDLTTFIISGVVKKHQALCGEENILVEYRELISGVNFVRDSVRTEADGSYSFVVNPNTIGLSQISIVVPNVQTLEDASGNEVSVLFDFEANSQNIFNNVNNFPQFTTVNFTDYLKYPVALNIKNACGFPIANQPVAIRIYTDDGCYDQNFVTNSSGNWSGNLPVFNYKMVVTGLVGGGVTNVENAAKNYLELRPSNFYLLDEHYNAQGGIVDSDFVLKMIYHKAPTINMESQFERYLCDDPFNPPIIEQGTDHTLTFTISEQHQGNVCLVEDGYISIRNAASSDLSATIINHNGSSFPAYTFTARGPNIIAPHVYDLSLQYFNDDGILQGTFSTGIIVEGSSQLPGTGVQTIADSEDGEIKLPLFVLRDPPGDGGYTEIAAGTTISQEMVITKTDVNSGGFTLDGNIAGGFVALIGTFFQREVQNGTETSQEASYAFDITTTQSFATSSEEGAVGRDASVVVGTGLSTQYGLQRKLVFEDNCTPIASTRIGYGIGGFKSEFVYTIGFIEGLVDKYNREIELIKDGLLTLVDSDGTILTEGIAIAKTENLRDTWIEMLNYFDKNTAPHYVLCSDNTTYEDLPLNARGAYLGWRNSFCNLIGEYEGETFVMDEDINWTPDLITAYNNTIAYTESIKDNPNNINNTFLVSQATLYNPSLLITQQYNANLGANIKSASVVDVTGGSGGYTRTVEAQQSSYTSYSVNNFHNVERAGGLYLSAGADYELAGFEGQVFTSDNSIGYRAIIETSLGTSASTANTAFSSITYNISDNDPEDQIATLILQAPLQNHSPYFIRLGGQSSCPYETALTPNEDNDPLKVDDADIAVVVDPVTGSTTPFPPKQFFIEQGQAGVFTVRVSNSSGIIVPRDVEIFLDQNSNPLGAMVTLGGTNLNNGNKVLTNIPAFGSLDQLLLVERPSASPYYDFNDILIGVRDVCDGEAKYISISVNFRSPCSSVSLISPIDQFVVNRQNPNDPLDREVIPFEIRDYNSSNLNLQYIQLQYRRLGNGSNWQNVPGGIFTRTFLKNIDDMNVPGTFPSFFWEWDITGQYALVPDGDYQVRAIAFCGTGGITTSNPIPGSIKRSIILNQGFPEPADKIFTIGDEISATYVTDLDCSLYNSLDSIDNYITLINTNTGAEVPFTYTCFENKLAIQITGNVSDYDGQFLKFNYYNIGNVEGNIAPNIEWTFKVVTQLLDWAGDSLEVSIVEGTQTNILASIMNTSGMVVNNVQLNKLSALLNISTSGNISVPGNGILVNINVNANLPPGNYYDTLYIDGLMGRRPALPVKIIILPAPVIPLIDPNLPDSMLINVNWRFVAESQLSQDTFDVIYALINGEVRGYGNIQKIGPFYAAQLYVYGDSLLNQGDQIEFGVYNSDEDLLYENLTYNNITWVKNLVRATVADPEVLLIDSTLLDLSRGIIYVDESNTNSQQDGISWNTAFSKLQDALAIAIIGDTIWMAEGVYKPTENNDRSISFEINTGVSIYGGFHTGDTTYGQRGNNTLTIISGDVSQGGNSADYSLHVVKNNASGVLLDNVTIKDGNANGNGIDANGAGLLNNGSIILKNIKMLTCYADGQGAFIDNHSNIIFKGGTIKIQPGQPSVMINRSGANLTIENNVNIED